MMVDLLEEQLPAQRQQTGPAAVGQEAEGANADKAARQNVQQKPPQELICRDSHLPLFVPARVILPSERDLIVFETDQAMVGDCHSMCVASQIVKHVIWSTKRWLSVDDPVFAKQRSQKRAERTRVGKRPEYSGENQSTLPEEPL
jgi:hypothetical protein